MALRAATRYGATQTMPGGGQQPATGGMRIGGMTRGAGKLGNEKYLWLLVALEVLAVLGLRHGFRRYHGG